MWLQRHLFSLYMLACTQLDIIISSGSMSCVYLPHHTEGKRGNYTVLAEVKKMMLTTQPFKVGEEKEIKTGFTTRPVDVGDKR